MICPSCTTPFTGLTCSRCGAWNLASELGNIRGVGAGDVVPIAEVEAASVDRISSGGGFDLAFNGGLVKSQSTIMTGPPGSGKTTLLLQVASRIAIVTGLFAWLISAEQSSAEIRLTVDRLALPNPEKIIVLKNFGAGGELDEGLFKKYPPGMIILDSLTALVGGNERAGIEVGKTYKRYSIKHSVPTFVIVQVNKEGDLAGRMRSQHDLDTIASLWPPQPRDPKRFQYSGSYRKLEIWKNRFGPQRTDALASWFDMTAKGFVDAPPEEQKKRMLDEVIDVDYVLAHGSLEEVVLARQHVEREAKDATADYKATLKSLVERETRLAVEPATREVPSEPDPETLAQKRRPRGRPVPDEIVHEGQVLVRRGRAKLRVVEPVEPEGEGA
jgi:predicted ATP-dependent serine protease